MVFDNKALLKCNTLSYRFYLLH